jgi:hypothetical protein
MSTAVRSADTSSSTPARSTTRRALLAVIAVSTGLRVAAALFLGNSVTPLPGIFDQVSYHELALRVLGGHGFSFGTDWWPATAANSPTAHWSFLYVLYLAGVYGVTGPIPIAARVLQALVVGILHPWVTYRIGARIFDEKAGLAAAAIVAGYAYFVYYAAALLTESFYVVAILWAVDRAMALSADGAGQRRNEVYAWAQLGACLAVAVLLRQVFIIVVPLILAWAWWKARAPEPRPWRGRWRAWHGVAVAAAVVVAAVLPWTARNYRAFHRLVPLNTNAGFAFYWGNHPIHGTRFIPILPDGTYQALIPQELRSLDEAALDQALMRRGIGFVTGAPVRFLLLSVSRVEEYVKFWPSRESGRASNVARVASFGVCLPLMVAGVLLAVVRGRRAVDRRDLSVVALPLGIAGLYALLHFVTWTLVRYRLPVDALLLPFAGLALATVSQRLHATVTRSVVRVAP